LDKAFLSLAAGTMILFASCQGGVKPVLMINKANLGDVGFCATNQARGNGI
jgi:hypothetical protein